MFVQKAMSIGNHQIMAQRVAKAISVAASKLIYRVLQFKLVMNSKFVPRAFLLLQKNLEMLCIHPLLILHTSLHGRTDWWGVGCCTPQLLKPEKFR